MIEDRIETEQFTCYTLRHVFSISAIENGLNLQVPKTKPGHSGISMIIDLYTHVLGDEKRRRK